MAIGEELLAPERYLLVFITSALAILPLAGWMGRATEQLAERMGEGIGGLLNATFGNAADSSLLWLRCVLGSTMWLKHRSLVPFLATFCWGAAMVAGGLRHPEQHYNPAGARAQATMLTLAAIALILPAAFEAAAGTTVEGLG